MCAVGSLVLALTSIAGCRARERARPEPSSATSSATSQRRAPQTPPPRREVREPLPELGAGAPRLSPEVVRDLELMLNARDFGGLAVGAGGDSTHELRAFRRTLEHPEAGALFAHVVARGTPEGKAFGMAGLYLVDEPRFALALEQLEGSTEPVNVWMSGCGGGLPKTLGQVLAHPDAPWLEGPSDTPSAYYARHGHSVDLESEDVVGGFLPYRLSAGRARR